MKKFKLIKNFCDSGLEEGDIITFPKDSNITQFKSKEDSSYLEFTLKEVEKYTENWEVIPEYEIISLLSNEGPEVNVILTYEGEYCVYRSDDNSVEGTLTKSYCRNLKKVKIHSIKRLSDNVIFTLGDLICSDNLGIEIPCILKSIIENNGKIHMAADTPITDEETRQSLRYTGFGQNLDTIYKIDYLFMTEDGVPIFLGDDYWTYDYTSLDKIYPVGRASCTHTGDGAGRKYFSTKAKAFEYVLMNKSCLSINDILSIAPKLSQRLIDGLKTKVNEKI